jgi:probable addiction module antidote protein
MRSLAISLNAALRTADAARISAAIDTAIHAQKNITEFALKAGLGRVTLYRVFRSKRRGPTLDIVIRVLRVLGFQFVVEFVRQPKISPRRSGPLRKSNVHLELGSNSKRASEYLTRAFKTNKIVPIVAAFSGVLRAQENVVELADRTIRSRTSLYHAFTAPRIPTLGTVLSFLEALGLRLAVKPLPGGTTS